MRRIFGKPGFRGRAVLWAVMVTLVLLLGGCPQPDGGGGTTTYTITFNANGGEPAPEAQTVAEGGKVTEPAAMTKANHAFGGWYKEAALTTPWNFATDTVTGDMTLYAKWTGVYTVTFDARGGTPVPPAQTVASGGKATKPADPAMEGYLLAGWFKEDTFANRWNFDTDTVTGNITLYAKWGEARTVTFDAGGGEPEPEAQTVAEGGTVTEPAAPEKTGYLLAGWYSDTGLTQLWNFATDTVTGNITLYAKWTRAYTVTFETNGGTAVTAQIVAEGGKATEPAVPEKTGLFFGGWYKEAGLTNWWNFFTDTVTGDITLYAEWIAIVRFDSNGGESEPAVQPVAEGGKATEPAAPEKAGYFFGGWYREDTFTTPWNFSTDTVTTEITLYAKWTAAPPGTKTSYTGDGITFRMAWVPGGITFPKGTNDTGTPATVADAYEIGETEVTYELWYAVRAWAESGRYRFDNNPGREGSSASNNNTPPSANKQEPVTLVSWFDAVVWLNALTEWVNTKEGKSLEPVYYYDSAYTRVARSNYSGYFVKEDDSYSYATAYAKPGATGFRLPTSNEWELAARWRNDAENTVDGYTNPYFTQGDSASGATADYNNTTATGAVAWYSGNSSMRIHAVKMKRANGLGLYDMSGNVEEWCYEWSSTGSYRISRGGSWSYGASGLQVGLVFNYNPDLRINFFGFRPSRTAN